MTYEEQYAEASVLFSSFAFANTGLIKSQTLLKLETYNLVMVPWQLGMKRGILLGSFSGNELNFFQRWTGSLASLNLAVQRPDAREPVKIFSRCHISSIGQMKGKEGVGVIVFEWRPLPPDLARVLGEHLDLLSRLRAVHGDLGGKTLPVNPDTGRRLGYNNYAVLRKGQEQHKIALFSLGAACLEFLMPMTAPDQAPGETGSVDLFFLKYRFSVPATIETSSRLPTGVQRVKAGLGFSPELVHILEEYYLSHR